MADGTVLTKVRQLRHAKNVGLDVQLTGESTVHRGECQIAIPRFDQAARATQDTADRRTKEGASGISIGADCSSRGAEIDGVLKIHQCISGGMTQCQKPAIDDEPTRRPHHLCTSASNVHKSVHTKRGKSTAAGPLYLIHSGAKVACEISAGCGEADQGRVSTDAQITCAARQSRATGQSIGMAEQQHAVIHPRLPGVGARVSQAQHASAIFAEGARTSTVDQAAAENSINTRSSEGPPVVPVIHTDATDSAIEVDWILKVHRVS